MFKKLILAVAFAIPMSMFAQKFGVVDIETVFQAMPETAAMQNQISEASKKYQAEFDQLNEELNKLFAEFQAMNNDPNTPDAIKERRQQDIQERAQKVEQFRNTASQDIQRLQETLVLPIQQKIQEAIQAVGQEGDYTFIFNNDQLYKGNTVVNVTNDVKAKLGL